MPLLTVPGIEAMANVKRNALATWPARGEQGSRLEPLVQPGCDASFRLSVGEKIFTIGSCFARNIEVLLEQHGFAIPARAIVRSDPDFAAIGHSILNLYGTPSILNELRWALDPACPFREDQAFFEIYPGKFVDAHLNHALKPAPIGVVRARRRAITNAYRAIDECRVVIVTLGLAECWLDTATGFYLNTAPRRAMIRAEPERFELHVLSYDEVLGAVEAALALLQANRHGELRVLLTVSPVALTSTFRDEDVIVANCYSKSVLRAAAEAIRLRHDFVDYFASYESVTLSERARALEDDQIHPSAEIVRRNTARLMSAYLDPTTMDAQDIREAVNETPVAAIGLLSERLELLEGDPELALALLNAASRVDRLDLVEAALPHVGDLLPIAEAMLARARIALARGDAPAALALLGEVPRRRSARTAYWTARLAAEVATDALDAARQSMAAWSETFPRSAEPFRVMAQAYAARGMTGDAAEMFELALDLLDDDARTLLDYAEMLLRIGRPGEARALLACVRPSNPAETDRLARLRLRTAPGGPRLPLSQNFSLEADAA